MNSVTKKHSSFSQSGHGLGFEDVEQLKTAKNILDLDRRMSMVYGQGSQMTSTARSQSN